MEGRKCLPPSLPGNSSITDAALDLQTKQEQGDKKIYIKQR